MSWAFANKTVFSSHSDILLILHLGEIFVPWSQEWLFEHREPFSSYQSNRKMLVVWQRFCDLCQIKNIQCHVVCLSLQSITDKDLLIWQIPMQRRQDSAPIDRGHSYWKLTMGNATSHGPESLDREMEYARWAQCLQRTVKICIQSIKDYTTRNLWVRHDLKAALLEIHNR